MATQTTCVWSAGIKEIRRRTIMHAYEVRTMLRFARDLCPFRRCTEQHLREKFISGFEQGWQDIQGAQYPPRDHDLKNNDVAWVYGYLRAFYFGRCSFDASGSTFPQPRPQPQPPQISLKVEEGN